MKLSNPYLEWLLGWIEPNMDVVFKDDTVGYIKELDHDILTVYNISTDETTSILLAQPSTPDTVLPHLLKSIDGKDLIELFSNGRGD